MTRNSIAGKVRSDRNEKPEPWKVFARKPEVPQKVLPVEGSCLGWGLQTFCTNLSSISSKTCLDLSIQIKARWDFMCLQVRSIGLSRVFLPELRQWTLCQNADCYFYVLLQIDTGTVYMRTRFWCGWRANFTRAMLCDSWAGVLPHCRASAPKLLWYPGLVL